VARRYRYSGANWDPRKHPRDGNGRFTARLKPKLSQSIRVSPSSVSYNGGVRLQVVPGRANLYVGGLVRVERVNGGNLFKRQTDAAVNSVARRFGDEGGRSNLAQVLKGNPINVKGIGAQASLRRGNPTFRLSRTPTTRAADQVSVRRRAASVLLVPTCRALRTLQATLSRRSRVAPLFEAASRVSAVRAGRANG